MLQQVAEGLGRDDPQVDRDPVVGPCPDAVRPRRRRPPRPAGGRRGARRARRVARRWRSGRCPCRSRPSAAPSPRPRPPSLPGARAAPRPAPRRSAAPSRAAGARRPSPGSPSRSSAARTFSSTFGPSPLTSRIRSSSAAACRSSIVRCRARRRAAWRVFAPRPGTLVTSTSEAGNFASASPRRGSRPSSSSASIFSCERLADARNLGRPARPRQLGDRDRAFAYRLRRRAVGEHPVFDRAVQLVQGRQLVEGGGDLRVGHLPQAIASPLGSRGMPARSERDPAWLVLPTYNEAETIERSRRGGTGEAPARRRVLVVDDSSPDGTGEIVDRLAAERRRASRSCTGRARKASARPISPASAARWRRRRPRRRDGRRLLPRPRLPAPPARRRRATPTW